MNEMADKAKSKRHEEEKLALRKQMALEQKERQDIEDLKEEEKRNAEEQGARGPATRFLITTTNH